jgi:hypothetical protein
MTDEQRNDTPLEEEEEDTEAHGALAGGALSGGALAGAHDEDDDVEGHALLP